MNKLKPSFNGKNTLKDNKKDRNQFYICNINPGNEKTISTYHCISDYRSCKFLYNV